MFSFLSDVYGMMELVTCSACCVYAVFPYSHGAFVLTTATSMASYGLSNFRRWQLYPSTASLFAVRIMGSQLLGIPLALASVILSVVVPHPVLLPPSGPHNVGITDLEVERDRSKKVLVRMYYPAVAGTGTGEDVPYFPYQKSIEAFIDFGAPDVLKKFKGLMMHWRLVKMDVELDGQIAPSSEGGYPVVISSHGDGGNKECMSNYLRDLASKGSIVIAVEHRDGTAQMTINEDGSIFPYHKAIRALQEKESEYEWKRREQLETRTAEIDTLIEAVRHGRFPKYKNHMDSSNIVLHGHSFGGATVLTSLARMSSATLANIKACVVFDPAVDWMPDDSRTALVEAKYADMITPTKPGQRKNSNATAKEKNLKSCPIQFQYCSGWEKSGFGFCNVLMSRVADRSFAPGTTYCVLKGSGHISFTDFVFLMPHKLSLALGLSGERNPILVAVDINCISTAFLEYCGIKLSVSNSNSNMRDVRIYRHLLEISGTRSVTVV
eukprot:m.341381 g.341381  ORF g.341381 m.341381 type:complete len:495 (-) comp20077_c0_seq1:65-1549(-)